MSWFSEGNVPLSFHCFENLTVLNVIQSWSSDQNVLLSFHCFENLTVLNLMSWSSDQNIPGLFFHCFENLTVLHVVRVRSIVFLLLLYSFTHVIQSLPGFEASKTVQCSEIHFPEWEFSVSSILLLAVFSLLIVRRFPSAKIFGLE